MEKFFRRRGNAAVVADAGDRGRGYRGKKYIFFGDAATRPEVADAGDRGRGYRGMSDRGFCR